MRFSEFGPPGAPTGEFRLNRDSWQADGLAVWFPLWGTIAPNSHHYDVAFNGSPVFKRAPERQGIELVNGSSQYLLSTGTPVLTYPFTLNAWVYPADVSGTYTVWGMADGGTTNHEFYLYLRGGSAGDPVGFSAIAGGSSNIINSTTGYTASEWYMVTGVGTSATSRDCLINAGSKGTTTTSRAPNSMTRFAIGARCTSTPNQFCSAIISDARIYNRALSDNELMQLYNPQTRFELWEPVIKRWFVLAPVAGASEKSRPVRPVRSMNLPISQLRI